MYWNPARWPTRDGYIPFRVFDLYAAALLPSLALVRLNTAQAIGMVAGDKQVAERAWSQTTREIYQVEG